MCFNQQENQFKNHGGAWKSHEMGYLHTFLSPLPHRAVNEPVVKVKPQQMPFAAPSIARTHILRPAKGIFPQVTSISGRPEGWGFPSASEGAAVHPHKEANPHIWVIKVSWGKSILKAKL